MNASNAVIVSCTFDNKNKSSSGWGTGFWTEDASAEAKRLRLKEQVDWEPLKTNSVAVWLYIYCRESSFFLTLTKLLQSSIEFFPLQLPQLSLTRVNYSQLRFIFPNPLLKAQETSHLALCLQPTGQQLMLMLLKAFSTGFKTEGISLDSANACLTGAVVRLVPFVMSQNAMINLWKVEATFN